jgi:virginiamycin B lyase
MFGLGRSLGAKRTGAHTTLIGIAAVALLLVPSGAQAQKKKLKVSVQTSSQNQALNQGQLQVKYNAKGLDKLTATAKATPSEGGQINFAAKATKRNPKKGTLRLPLTNAGEAALEDCDSLRVRVQAKGKPSKTANASRMLAEDDPVCAEPVREFETETPASFPLGIDAGPDGALWFAHSGAGANSLGRMTTDGEYSNFHIPVPEGTPAGTPYGHTVNDVVAGPEGDDGIWVTPMRFSGFGDTEAFVRRVDPATGAVTEYGLGESGSAFGSKITVGPDGALWLTHESSQLFRVSTAGEVTAFPVTARPYGIAAGSDGGVWFTTPDANAGGTAAVGRLDPATGETEMFPLSDPAKRLGYMTADRAGRLWFTTPVGNTIGRIDPGSGEIVEFEIPTENSKPIGITFANDGSLWFTEASADNIGRYDPASGQFTEYPLETLGSIPFDIVEGDDGRIYFTEAGTGRIGQLDPDKAPTGDPNPSDGRSDPPFIKEGRCPQGVFLCQQQVSTGGTFQIGDALNQELPPETLRLTSGIRAVGPMVQPTSGPMLESQPLDTVVGGQEAVTRVGLAGPALVNQVLPTLDVTVPIDLFVSPVGSTEGGCVIGPIVQELAQVPDDEGDMGATLAGDAALQNVRVQPGMFADETFAVPEARGCGALTPVINSLLGLPSPSGENSITLPYSILLRVGGG